MEQERSYTEAEQLLQSFFDNVLLPEAFAMRKQFAQPMLDELRSLRTELQRIRKDDKERYGKVIEHLSDTTSRLKALFSASTSQTPGSQWHERLYHLCEKLPETITARQEKERFAVSEKDGSLIVLLKKAKYRVFQTGRKLSKKSPAEYHWKQTIALRDLVREALFHDTATCNEIIASEYAHPARALAFLLNEIHKEVDAELDTNASDDEPVEAGSDGSATYPDPKTAADKEDPVLAGHAGSGQEGDIMPVPESRDSGDMPSDNNIPTFRISVLEHIEEHLNEAISLLIPYHNGDIPFSSALDKARNRVSDRLRRAGTLEYPFRKLSNKRRKRAIDAVARDTRKLEQQWSACIRSQLTDLEVQLELARFGAGSKEAQEQLLKESHLYFRDHFYLPLEEGVRFLREMIAGLGKIKSAKKAVREIEKARESFRTVFYEKTVVFIRDTDIQEKFVTKIKEILSELELQMNGFTETLLVAEKRKLNVPWPEIKTDDFAWRAIASRFLKDKAIQKLQPEKQKLPDLLAEQLILLEETANIIDVNLEAALTSELKEGDNSAFQVAVTGLERAISSIEKGIRSVRERQNAYEEQFGTLLPAAFQKLADVMLTRTYDQFELKDKALQMKTRALSWKEKGLRWNAIVLEQSELTLRYTKLKLNHYRKPVARFLGWKEEGVASLRHQQDLTEYLTQSASQEKMLPFIYQRLFKRSFLIDRRFYIDDQNNVGRLLTGFEQWKKNMAWNVAVVGQKGSGKSTLLHFFLEELGDRAEVVNISIDTTITSPAKLLRIISEKLGYPATEDTDELIDKIRSEKNKRVLLFEGLQNIYVRNINGYEAIRSFQVLMAQTTSNLFWLVTCSSSAWEFFDRMFEVRQLFSQIVRTDQLTADHVEKGIMIRHKATGYELEFQPSEKIRRTRAYRKLLGKEQEIQRFLRDEYFQLLAEISDGNFSSAMIFWLQSIQEFNDTRFLIGLREVADIDVLDITSRDILFALAALVRHDTLTADDLTLAMHNKLSDSKLILGQLSSRGLVVSTKNGYLINHLAYRQIKELLNRKNILH